MPQNPRKSDAQNGHAKTKATSPLARPASKNVKLIPPDGGWGWIIIFATCITLMVLPTAVTCFGVIVPFILRDFDSANIANVSWIPGIAVAVLNLAGPWVSAMLTLYSHRRLAAIGSVVMVASIIGSSFANSLMIWYLTYGLLLGFGCSLSHVMGLLITQEYFLERRHLANGLAMAGGSVGQMLIPLVMQSLFEGFGLRGGLLIYSGVVLQALVAAMLFQPSRWHYKLASPASGAEVELLEKAPPKGLGQSPRMSEVHAMEGRDRASSWTPEALKPADVRRVRQLGGENRMRSMSVSASQQQLDEKTIRSSQAALNYLGSMGSLASVAPAHVQEMPANMTLAEMRHQLKTRNTPDTRPKWLRCVPRCPDVRAILNLKLLKDPVFLLMSGAMGLGRLTYQQFNVLVPSFAREIGIEPTAAASLVTILASSDTVARLAVPIMCGKLSKYVSSLTICLVEFLICGIGSFALAFSTDFTSMVISCVIYGLGIGGITGLTLVVIVQSFGMEQLTAAFGLNVFIGGLIVFPGIIIIGYVQVFTKSFPVCFYIVGGICGVCILLWAPLNWMLKRRRSNQS